MNIYKTSIYGLIGLTSCSQIQTNSIKEEKQTESPNIILIITDDQGFGDIGYNGNPVIKTPVMDSLAEMSVRMNNFYVSPVSAPTRSSLMTGRYALRTGVYDTYNGGAIMATSEVTIAEVLKEAGYKTASIGKWHLGDSYPSRPIDQGFDYSLNHGGGGMGQPGDHPYNFFRRKIDSSYFDPYLFENGEEKKFDGYCTNIFTKNAINFIEKNKDDKFFLYLAYNAPHTPLEVPEEYYNIYKDADVTNAFDSVGQPLKMSDKDIDDAKKVYGMVTCIDDNLRKLFNKLKELGIDENTLIIFMSDNGPQQKRYIQGLRGLKQSTFEGGVKTPFYLYLKNKYENKDIDALTAHIDVLPTICDICNIAEPSENPLDGVSFLPYINGKEKQPERILYNEWSRGYPVLYKNLSCRKGNYKFVGKSYSYESDSLLMLYNIKTDPYELNDISKENPEMVVEMKKLIEEWYWDIINSHNILQHPRIFIGTENENPVILNRNDLMGNKPKPWGSEEVSGYWLVDIREAGIYRAKMSFVKKFKREGRAVIRIKNTQQEYTNWDTTVSVINIPEFKLSAGETTLEGWYESWGEIYTPLTIEIEKVD